MSTLTYEELTTNKAHKKLLKKKKQKAAKQSERERYKYAVNIILILLPVFIVFYMTLRNMLKQKRLSEMKTDFINNMTHELKTPLTAIRAYADTLLEGGLDDAEHNRGFVEQIADLGLGVDVHETAPSAGSSARSRRSPSSALSGAMS